MANDIRETYYHASCRGWEICLLVMMLRNNVFLSDWNELFTTKCFACGFPVEAGDRWVEALNNNYHSQCFNCTVRMMRALLN